MNTSNAYYELKNSWKSIDEIVSVKQLEPNGLCLDLGSGYVKPEGFIGIDNFVGVAVQDLDKENMPDIIMDLNTQPLPFPDNCCTEIRSSHFLEHSNLDHIFQESYRVLSPNGRFMFAVPYANSAEGMFPGHNLFLTETFFQSHRLFNERFSIVNEEYFPSALWPEMPWLVRKIVPFNLARKFFFNVCWQMQIEAVVKK